MSSTGDISAALPSPADGGDGSSRKGFAAGIAAYGVWGFFPLMFRMLDGVSPVTIVANRVIWSLLFVGALLIGRGRLGEVRAALFDRKAVFGIIGSAVLLAGNWLVFIWAVETDRVLEVSFGYFLNPLVSVAIGMVILGERQNRWQAFAIGIAVIAGGVQAAGVGQIPYISLALAFSFGFYGYLRKTVNVRSTPGLFIETLVMLPFALVYLGYLFVTEGAGPHGDPWLLTWLVFTGPATALALILFAFAARQLRLTTIGMLQYLAPSMHFITAIWLFGEHLSSLRLASFALIWLSLAVFSYDSYRRRPVRRDEAKA
jgi:chloramphenicol-sensitive protein RarD